MVSHQLVEQWRTRLAAWQQRLDEGRPRPWLARAYVRVLSYLLAQYAHQGDDRESARTEDPVRAGTSSMTRLDVELPELYGKPARTRTEIRSVLEAVQANVPRPKQGPLVEGLRPDDPIAVAAFYSVPEVARLLRMLDVEGIEWTPFGALARGCSPACCWR